MLLTPLFAVRDRGDVWIIYAVGALYGLSYIALSADLNGLIKEIVPEDLLAEANGALQTVKQGLRLVGPLAGAGLYAAVGGWTLAAVGAIGFIGAATAVTALRVREARPEPAQLRWITEIGAGVRHMINEPVLRRAVLGAALAALAAGVAIFAPGALLLAYPNLWLAFLALVLAGFGLPIAIVGLNTLIQRRTPAPLLGRVAAASDALISGPQALSIGVGAVLVSVVDYRLLFVVMGVVMLGAAAYLWMGRRLSPPSSPPSSSTTAVRVAEISRQ